MWHTHGERHAHHLVGKKGRTLFEAGNFLHQENAIKNMAGGRCPFFSLRCEGRGKGRERKGGRHLRTERSEKNSLIYKRNRRERHTVHRLGVRCGSSSHALMIFRRTNVFLIDYVWRGEGGRSEGTFFRGRGRGRSNFLSDL